MRALPPLWAYAMVLVIAYGENVFPPVPGDMVVVFGGYLAGMGKLHLGVVIFLSTAGGALGFMTVFAAGYLFGTAVLDSNRFRWFPKDGLETARRWIRRYGYGVVAANRFLSGARSVISLSAGIAHMEPWRTAWWCTVSAALWTGLISYAGYAVGENWERIGGYLQTYGRIVLILLGLLAVGIGVYWYWTSSRRRSVRGRPQRDQGAER